MPKIKKEFATSPMTRKVFLGSRSIIGAMTIGINRKGRSCIARIRADAKVLPVSSKTRNASAKPPAIPPIVPIVDARITKLKFRFQSFVVVIFPSSYLFSSTIPDNSILLKYNPEKEFYSLLLKTIQRLYNDPLIHSVYYA